MSTLHVERDAPAARDESPGPRRTIGVLTIGQAPRRDRLGEEVSAVLGPGFRVIERGALDGLAEAEIDGLAPRDTSDYRLVTLLRSGRSVEIAKPAILERLQVQIRYLEEQEQVDATLLMCTGAFPRFEHARPLLAPQEALYGVVAALADGGDVGALIPLESQRAQALRKWQEYGLTKARVFPASPYGADPIAAVVEASGAARSAGVVVLFMDCFGYDLAMKAAARRAFGGPVVLARTLAARLIAELSE